MPTICLQCALRALLDHQPPPAFDETPEAHIARVHPDLDATQRERAAMEAELAQRHRDGNAVVTRFTVSQKGK